MSETKTAFFIRKLAPATGDMRLYRLDPPIEGYDYVDELEYQYEYVAVSATVVPYTGPETYIFPANAAGDITDWGELDGSYRGGLSHAEALAGAGYEVAS